MLKLPTPDQGESAVLGATPAPPTRANALSGAASVMAAIDERIRPRDLYGCGNLIMMKRLKF